MSFILSRDVAYFTTFDSFAPGVTGEESAVLCLSFSVVSLLIKLLLTVSYRRSQERAQNACFVNRLFHSETASLCFCDFLSLLRQTWRPLFWFLVRNIVCNVLNG